MPAIIAEKKIVVKAIDEVTEPLAHMNQRLHNLESALGQLDQKFNAGASSQQSFKASLNELKASAGQTDSALDKINRTIKAIPGKKSVDVNANTSEADRKIDDFQKTVDLLRRDKPTITPKADTTEANEKLHGLQRTTESVGHSFTRLRTIIAGTAIGGAISTGFISAFNGIKSGIKGAMGAGIQFNMTMQKMNATWDTLTGSASKAKSMSNSIVDLSNKLGWSVDVTNELAQQFYHVFDNQPETMKLTKSFLTMGDAIGLSDDRLQQVAMDFTHMLSSSKLQLGDLNQITDAFPMFGNALLDYERKVQHNSHLTMSELRKDISAGKIDAKDAETVFNQLGDRYKKASENLMGTLPGMFRQISSKWKELMGDMMAPTTNAANPVVKQISKWISSEGTTKEFERLGRAVNQGFGAIMKSLANTFGDGSVAKMLDNVVNSLTRFVQAASKWTANNAESIVKTIKSIGSIAGSVGKGAFDAIGDFLNILGHTSGHGLKGIADALESISKHKVALEMIGRALATYFVYSKLSKAAKGLSDIYSAVKGIAGTSATKIKDVMSALNGDYDGSGKLLNMLSDHQASKPVGPTGVLKQEAAKDGEKAGGNFLKSFMLKAKGLGRGIAGLFLPSSFLNVGSKIGSKMATGLSKAFKPAVIAIKKSGSALKDISAVISEKGFALKGKIAGSRFASAFVRAGGAIKGFATKYIIPETWLTAGRKAGTLFRSGFSTASSKLGDSFIGRFASKLGGSRLFSIGKGIGGKLVSGLNIAIGAVDILRALTGSHIHNRAKMAGKGIGTILGGAIGTVLGGPIGGAIGGMLGSAIGGKAGPALTKMFKGGIDFFKKLLKGDWSGAFGGIVKGFQKMWKGVTNWAKDTWKKVKDWWNNDDESSSSSSSHKSSSHKSKQPSEKEIKSLGGNHYSKTDIANVKEMNRAITTYTRSLKSLKEVVKHNDPTKSLNSMNKNLKNFIKQMLKSEKPLEKVSKTFKNFGKATKTIADSMKNLTGKHGLGEFDKDLAKLDKDTKHSKVGEFFERLAKSIKKSKLTDQFKSLTKYLGSMVKDWEHLVKPMKQAEKEFSSFEKTIGKLANKKTGLSKVDSDIKTLSKDLKKYDFGKELGKQMQTASKQLQGKHSFTKQFDNMTRSIEKSLITFRKTFQRDWTAMWKNLGKDAQVGLGQAVRTANSEFNSLRNSEHRFESGFLSSWKGWLSDVVSAMKSGFDKLAGIAGKSMQDIVSRLNRGITAINAVISDFGGDKQLGTIKYATGTSMAGGSGAGYSAHPGGEAVINDGQGPHKQELVWQPSKGWQLFAGLNRHVWLEPGAQIIPGERSHRILSRMRIPHYAYGNLSREQLDHIEDEFMSSPLDAAKQLMLGVTNWSSKVPLISDLGEATAIGFGHGIANVLKTAVGTVQHAIGGDWGPAISSAARHMWAKISRSFRDELKQVIQNESGGIETRIQDAAVDDINMKNGNPAQGLLQYIPQTFAKYAMPGHGNILAGFDQLMAFFNNSDYLSSIGFSPVLHKIDWLNAGPVGGRRYASGGHITDTQLALVGDNAEHDEYVINPYRDNAIPLLNQAWDKVRMRRPDLTDNQSTAASAELISLVKTAIDKLDNIDIHPRVYVDDMRRPINNRNAMDYARVMN